MSAANSNSDQITEEQIQTLPPKTLDERERDACGVGFIANLHAKPSHEILKAGIQALECNDHRGGCNYDGVTGDGSGLMTQIPWELLQKWADQENLGKIDPDHAAVGMFFLKPEEQEAARQEIDSFVEDSQFSRIGWRHVPVQQKVLG
jgi:glutamate synthase (ferredoxin)